MATIRQTFRLYPNKVQERQLFKARRMHQYVYNACLAGRKYAWETESRSLKYYDQPAEITRIQERQPGICGAWLSNLASYSKTC